MHVCRPHFEAESTAARGQQSMWKEGLTSVLHLSLALKTGILSNCGCHLVRQSLSKGYLPCLQVKLHSHFSGYVFLLITGIMLKAGLEGWGREKWNNAIIFDSKGLTEMMLLSALYSFCLGPLFTVFLVLLGDRFLSTIVLADLMVLVGPQLGPLADSMFVILLSDQPLSLASEALNGQSSMDAERAAQVLNSIFPDARIPSGRDSILLAFAIPASRYVLFAMLPFLCGLLFHSLYRLFFHKLLGNSGDSSEGQEESPSEDLATDEAPSSKSTHRESED